ncbi:hypothetical protein [Tenacibaculum amylolyticum]|uniref:hypothetical protein n=1 Tax=Tenacibaculum amylolyticum TaxID=104269 RepID=UPI003893BD4C
MNKWYYKKLKKSKLFTKRSSKDLLEKLQKEAKDNEIRLKKELKNMNVKDVEKLYNKYKL